MAETINLTCDPSVVLVYCKKRFGVSKRRLAAASPVLAVALAEIPPIPADGCEPPVVDLPSDIFNAEVFQDVLTELHDLKAPRTELRLNLHEESCRSRYMIYHKYDIRFEVWSKGTLTIGGFDGYNHSKRVGVFAELLVLAENRKDFSTIKKLLNIDNKDITLANLKEWGSASPVGFMDPKNKLVFEHLSVITARLLLSWLK